jgi:hypothetical protein
MPDTTAGPTMPDTITGQTVPGTTTRPTVPGSTTGTTFPDTTTGPTVPGTTTGPTMPDTTTVPTVPDTTTGPTEFPNNTDPQAAVQSTKVRVVSATGMIIGIILFAILVALSLQYANIIGKTNRQISPEMSPDDDSEKPFDGKSLLLSDMLSYTNALLVYYVRKLDHRHRDLLSDMLS